MSGPFADETAARLRGNFGADATVKYCEVSLSNTEICEAHAS